MPLYDLEDGTIVVELSSKSYNSAIISINFGRKYLFYTYENCLLIIEYMTNDVK